MRHIQSLTCLNILAPAYPDAPASLAQTLGIDPGERFYTPIGGNMGQWLVGYYADRIAAGELDCALIAGGEALATQMRGKGAGLSGMIDTEAGEGPRLLGDDREPTNAAEQRHGLNLPVQIYPLFEQALRGQYGRDPAAHRQALGELYAGFNAVAMNNPKAWRREPLSAADIAEAHAGKPHGWSALHQAYERHHRGGPGGRAGDDVGRQGSSSGDRPEALGVSVGRGGWQRSLVRFRTGGSCPAPRRSPLAPAACSRLPGWP